MSFLIALQPFHQFKAPLQLIVSLVIVLVIIPFVFAGAQRLFDSLQTDRQTSRDGTNKVGPIKIKARETGPEESL